jgi:hypothetical protein
LKTFSSALYVPFIRSPVLSWQCREGVLGPDASVRENRHVDPPVSCKPFNTVPNIYAQGHNSKPWSLCRAPNLTASSCYFNCSGDLIAERVETREQAAFLKFRGCDILQGFLIAKPLAPDDAMAFCQKLKTSHKNRQAGLRGVSSRHPG